MLLRMLDYTTADVGPIWPSDYVVKAQSLGLTRGVAAHGENDPITRADAAILLRNTLRTPTKEGEKLYAALSGGTPVENSILLATPETDPRCRPASCASMSPARSSIARPRTRWTARLSARAVPYSSISSRPTRSAPSCPRCLNAKPTRIQRAERQQIVHRGSRAHPRRPQGTGRGRGRTARLY